MWGRFLIYQIWYKTNTRKKCSEENHNVYALWYTYKSAFELQGRVKKDELEWISEKFLKLTRGAIIQQKVQSTLEKVSYGDAVKHPKCAQMQYLLMIYQKECSPLEGQMVPALNLLMLLKITLCLKTILKVCFYCFLFLPNVSPLKTVKNAFYFT